MPDMHHFSDKHIHIVYYISSTYSIRSTPRKRTERSTADRMPNLAEALQNAMRRDFDLSDRSETRDRIGNES